MRRFSWAIAAAAQALAEVADPEKAEAMAAYLYGKRYRATGGGRADIPFHGVQKPGRAEVLRELVAAVDPATQSEYEQLVLDLWSLPHREEKYLAIDLAARFKTFRNVDAIDLYERMIIEGAWWDFVDSIVTKLVNPVVLTNPGLWPRIDSWIESDIMWLRRSAIICQLKSKAMTDRDRLARYCVACIHEKEFFIRKAIGWALREFARTDPHWVMEFTDQYRESLSGLSYREATKHL